MTARRTPSPLAGWSKNGLPAFVSAVAPWQDKLTQAKLISGLFQPQLDTVTALLAPLCSFVFWYVIHRKSQKVAARYTLISLFSLIVCVMSCIILQITVDKLWSPPSWSIPWSIILIRIGWVLLYVAAFCSLGVTLACGMIMVGKQAAFGAGSRARPHRID